MRVASARGRRFAAASARRFVGDLQFFGPIRAFRSEEPAFTEIVAAGSGCRRVEWMPRRAVDAAARGRRFAAASARRFFGDLQFFGPIRVFRSEEPAFTETVAPGADAAAHGALLRRGPHGRHHGVTLPPRRVRPRNPPRLRPYAAMRGRARA